MKISIFIKLLLLCIILYIIYKKNDNVIQEIPLVSDDNVIQETLDNVIQEIPLVSDDNVIQEIPLVSDDNVIQETIDNTLSVTKLKKIAKERKLKCYSKLNKNELLKLLL